MLDMWRGEPFPAELSFKLSGASPAGGRLAKEVNTHSSSSVHGTLSTMPTRFLLDTGAAMSVVRWDTLSKNHQDQVIAIYSKAVGANGQPLDVVGQVTLSVSIGKLTCEQKFLVVRGLTVDCLLGSDFLSGQAAIIDCKERKLSLGIGCRCNVSIDMGKIRQTTEEISLTVVAAVDVEIPGSTIQVATGCVREDVSSIQEGLFEPRDTDKLPKHISAARSLNCIMPDNQVALQVMNTSPSPIKIHKGTILGTFTPCQHVLVVGQGQSVVTGTPNSCPILPDIDATCKHLSNMRRYD